MSVITMILNYNGKHSEVLIERLVGTQPTPLCPITKEAPVPNLGNSLQNRAAHC
jgi:hypothetical protein